MGFYNYIIGILSLFIVFIGWNSDARLFSIPFGFFFYFILTAFQRDKEGKASPAFLFFAMGALLMLFAESLISSSVFWFIDAWGILITLPLYFSHFLLMFNLALRTKRTSFSHLYLWGVLVGLYESWITKVEWNGYFSSPPIWGLFHGVATFEYLTLNFFYHPLFSFIFPLLVMEFLIYSFTGDPNALLPGHLDLLRKTKKHLWFLGIVLVLYPSAFLGYIIPGQIIINSLTVGISWALVYFFLYLYKKRNHNRLSIYDFRLSTKGMIFLILYLLWLYVYFMIYPMGDHLIPTDPIAYLIIILTYALTFFILWRLSPSPSLSLDKKPALPSEDTLSLEQDDKRDGLFTQRDLMLYIVLSLTFPWVFALVSTLSAFIAIIINYLGIFVGVLYYFSLFFKSLRGVSAPS